MPPTPASVPGEPTADDVGPVSDAFIRLMRCFARTRSQFLAAAQHNVEWSAHVLINSLAVDGPMRSSVLAELVQADPSTVSRQVGALVKDGFVERRADPVDGRASVLAVTAKGEQVYRDHKKLRAEHYQKMLAGWSPDELHAFADLLARFSDRYEQYRPSWLSPDESEQKREHGPSDEHEPDEEIV